MTSYDSGPRYTPKELSVRLGLNHPTEEQAEVISAPVAPLLVVAGAGSGKTETMAARVLWLVANAHVRPDQILGLTFTRKAAGELAHRVRLRLGQLRRRIDDPRSERLAGEPTIATYHSFAARIVSEHGLRAGFEPSVRLLSEAASWQLADEVVRSYTGDMSQVDKAASTVTAAVRALAAEMAEHLVQPDDLATWTGRFSAELSGLPGTIGAAARGLLANQRARLQLMPLVRRYAERKAALEAMDFGDQLARAALVARDHPEVGAVERQRFTAVLLDEYQDTSHAQVVLLRSLFGGGHPVTAVGDPCQSIYGWRGASAGTLERFPADFPRRDGRPAEQRALRRSFRNREQILRVANEVSAPLRDSGARVVELTGDGRPGRVECALLETFEDEAQWIASRIQRVWADTGPSGPDSPAESAPPTTAVLVRLRAQIAPIEAALRERGIPVEVVGLGGLLDTPEVRDVVSTLRVLADPMEGAALLRLLTGPRWRIGPRDLVMLHRRARTLARERRHPDAPVTDRLDDASLIEALDDLGPAEDYSPAGFARLTAYQRELDDLRRTLDQPLPDLIGQIERTLGLSVEVALRGGDAALARGHLDALGEVAAGFSAESEGPTLSAFLAYLSAAEDEERGLSPGEVDVVEGAVQILTAHAAKGLEWDVVAVAGLTHGVWPGGSKRSDHFLAGLGVLPFPLRGDRSGLPVLRPATEQKDLVKAIGEFEDEWRAHDEREERRLAYVAVTRPRRWLLASGYWWGPAVKKPRGPSAYLTEIAEVCHRGHGQVAHWADPPANEAVNPTTLVVESAVWPHDPLGGRRPAMAAAADLVRSYLDGPLPDVGDDEQARRWRFEADLLLRERAEQSSLARAAEVVLPAHLSVSQLVALRRNPGELARSLRRPLPHRPDPVARRGTAFHAWLEQRFGADRLLDLDELPGAADEGAADDDRLDVLRDAFLSSEWADRVPIEVEVPFATEIGGIVIRGRMDAVFAADDGRYEVVDWKTGRPPSGAEAVAASIQLAAYRVAWAGLAEVPVERVSAAFHYVADNLTVRPVNLLDSAGLHALIRSLPRQKSGS